MVGRWPSLPQLICRKTPPKTPPKTTPKNIGPRGFSERLIGVFYDSHSTTYLRVVMSRDRPTAIGAVPSLRSRIVHPKNGETRPRRVAFVKLWFHQGRAF